MTTGPVAERASTDARAAAETAARESYGQLVALLVGISGDVELAEDALAAAFEQALRTWPERGVPDNPPAWLFTTARNRLRDVWKSAAHQRTTALTAAAGAAEQHPDPSDPFDAIDPLAIPDHRLALLFICAHPAIRPDVRTPLMLQTVLGIDSADIARVFAVPPAAMQQRLVRAKRRIRDARIPFVVPDRTAIPERLPPVLEAIYGCCAVGWELGVTGSDSLLAEAHYLALTLATLLDREAEAWALAALIAFARSRAVDSDGPYQPVAEQDPATWDADLIATGDRCLRLADRPGRPPGRFQLEAAIQAVHCARARTGRTDWPALRTLYAALLAVAPSLGARIAYAAVIGRTEGPEPALELLDQLPPERERLASFHATRAHLLERARRPEGAAAAYAAAADRSAHQSSKAYLMDRRAALVASAPAPEARRPEPRQPTVGGNG